MPTNLFRGDAPAQAKVYQLTPVLPEPGDTFSVVINRKRVSFVAETSQVADVVAGLVAAINASTIPEFTEVLAAASVDGDSLTVTAQVAGQEIVLTMDTEDAGGFTIEVSTLAAGNPGQNETQRLSIPAAASGGTFTLTFAGQTTAGIAYNAGATAVETALETLSNISAGDVVVTGASPTWFVEFDSSYANTDVPSLSGDGSSLSGAASITIQTTTEGTSSVNEIKTVGPADFNDLFETGQSTFRFRVRLDGSIKVGGVLDAIGLTAAEVQSSLESVASIGSGNVLVQLVGDYDSEGFNAFAIEFVADLGGQDLPPLGLEIDNYFTGFVLAVGTTQQGSSTGIDEIQTVRINGSPTGGTFALTFQGQTTAGIAYDATAAAVEAALEALSNIDDVTVTTSGWTYTVTFEGTNSATDVQQMTSDASSLTGGSVTAVTTQATVSPTNEVQQISFSQTPGGGTFTLTVDLGSGDETTAALDYDASAAEVETALEGLTSGSAGDFDVSGDEGGPWQVEFTGDYAATDVAGLSGTSSLTGGGTQSLTLAVNTISLGPQHWNDPANWTLARIPETGDAVILEQGNTHLRHGLRQIQNFTADNSSNTFTTAAEQHFALEQKVRLRNSGGGLPSGLSAATDYYISNPTAFTFQLSATRGGSALSISDDGTGTHSVAVELASLVQHARYTGQIGLPVRSSNDYYEYRPTALKIGIQSSGNKKVTLGLGEGSGSGLLRLDFETYEVAGLVRDTSGGQETQVPALLIENTNSSSVWEVESGEVGFAFHAGTTGEIATLTERGGSVVLGEGMTVSTSLVRTAGELLSIGEVILSGTIDISG